MDNNRYIFIENVFGITTMVDIANVGILAFNKPEDDILHVDDMVIRYSDYGDKVIEAYSAYNNIDMKELKLKLGIDK